MLIHFKGIVFWAKNVHNSDSNNPITPHRNDVALDIDPTTTRCPSNQHRRNRFLTTPPAAMVTTQANSEDSEQPIFQVLHEIRTLERIANRRNDLYVLRDRLIRRETRRV